MISTLSCWPHKARRSHEKAGDGIQLFELFGFFGHLLKIAGKKIIDHTGDGADGLTDVFQFAFIQITVDFNVEAPTLGRFEQHVLAHSDLAVTVVAVAVDAVIGLGKSQLDGKEKDIKELPGKKVGKASIANIYGVSWAAANNFIRTRGLG